jgi:hypothetical protein
VKLRSLGETIRGFVAETVKQKMPPTTLICL